MFQPRRVERTDRPGRYSERDEPQHNRRPDPDRAPLLFEDDRWPRDGLRTVLDEAPEPRPRLRLIIGGR